MRNEAMGQVDVLVGRGRPQCGTRGSSCQPTKR
jgi:hypothetical protein